MKTCTKCGLSEPRAKFGKHRRVCYQCRPRRTPEQERADWLKRAYGLTVEEWECMRADQHNACAACHAPFADTYPHTDHCHTTQKVRGLLCRECNLTLGLIHDSPTRLLSLVDYLARH